MFYLNKIFFLKKKIEQFPYINNFNSQDQSRPTHLVKNAAKVEELRVQVRSGKGHHMGWWVRTHVCPSSVSDCFTLYYLACRRIVSKQIGFC
jgi:hypothetical protein